MLILLLSIAFSVALLLLALNVFLTAMFADNDTLVFNFKSFENIENIDDAIIANNVNVGFDVKAPRAERESSATLRPFKGDGVFVPVRYAKDFGIEVGDYLDFGGTAYLVKGKTPFSFEFEISNRLASLPARNCSAHITSQSVALSQLFRDNGFYQKKSGFEFGYFIYLAAILFIAFFCSFIFACILWEVLKSEKQLCLTYKTLGITKKTFLSLSFFEYTAYTTLAMGFGVLAEILVARLVAIKLVSFNVFCTLGVFLVFIVIAIASNIKFSNNLFRGECV